MISRIFRRIQDFQDFQFRHAFYSLSGGLIIPGSARFHQFPFGNVLQIVRTSKISRFQDFSRFSLSIFFKWFSRVTPFKGAPFSIFSWFLKTSKNARCICFRILKISRFQDGSRCRFEHGFVRVLRFSRFFKILQESFRDFQDFQDHQDFKVSIWTMFC